MAHNVTLIRGDGTGPELVEAAKKVLDATGVGFNWDIVDAGVDIMETAGTPLPQNVLDSIRKNKVALKGPITTPIGSGFRSVNVALRKELDLYACIRPCKYYPGIRSKYQDVDLLIVRENTEDLYAGIEFQPHPDVAQSIKVITRPGCQRLFKYAFDMVRKQGRKRMTAVHKANIMKLTDGMFLEEFYKESKNYPDIKADDIIVDNCCMQLVINPEQFDVIVTENLYGDIISDLCAGLVGGLGMAASANIGEHCAVFEAVHGSAPDIAGKGIANPTALLLSSLMMLRYLGEHEKADRILNSVLHVCTEGKVLTGDLGGKATTEQYKAEVIRNATQLVAK